MSAPHIRQTENRVTIAVTNRALSARPYEEQIARICRFHPAAVIVREKDLPEEEYARLAEKVLTICRRYDVRCIYHTYPKAARAAGVKEIHLPLPVLRQYAASLSFFTTVGTSVHSREEAAEALRLGATYLQRDTFTVLTAKKACRPGDFPS